MIYFILLALLGAGGFQGSSCGDCSEIKVLVTGFRSSKGEAFLALYASKDGYPLDPAKALDKLKAPIQNGQAVFDVRQVKPGSYAFIAMHDENKNGRMDRNFLGMPKEGYGASNNPHMPALGPPSFESAMFKPTPGKSEMTIPLHYYPH